MRVASGSIRTRRWAASGLAVTTAATTRAGGGLQASRRHQSILGDQRAVAGRAKAAFSHPLAPKDPSLRNIAVPDSVHAKNRRQRAETLPPDTIKRRAQKALLHQLQQEVLWEGTVVDDAEHALIRHFLALGKNPKYRHARGMLVVGGREMIRELCAGGHAPRHLLVTEGKAVPEWASAQSATEIVRLDRRVAEECAPGNDGYIGDFDIPAPPLKERLIANQKRLERVLVLDNVDDPGTLGTVLRTAAGFQYDAIITTNHCADLYDQRVIRAARGAHFQSAVPIYTLRDEDGDDVDGMLNHVLQRNDLLPLCFAPQDDDATTGDRSSAVVGARPISMPRASPTAHAMRKESLRDFCLSRFTEHSDGKNRGYMLVAGPNHKRNLMRRLTQRLTRPPTQLLLDTPRGGESDLLIALSVVMHALRPAGHWDYLPVHERAEPSTMGLQVRQSSVDIGPDRLILDESTLNWDEDEQRAHAHERNELMKWKRMRAKTRRIDYDHWMEAEQARVREMLQGEHRRMVEPWQSPARPRHAQGAKGMPSWVPNIIDEYRQSLDRDRLVEEREVSEAFVRPSNYDKKSR